MEQKSSIKTVPDKEESLLPMRQWTFFIYRGFTIIHYVKTGLQGQQDKCLLHNSKLLKQAIPFVAYIINY